jgi:hypothetical protein
MHSDKPSLYQSKAREYVPDWLLAPEGLPPGFETCWGFLLRTEPWVLLDVSRGIAGLSEEDQKARALSRRYREPFVEVDTGGGVIGAFTRPVLHDTFPTNP